MAYLVNTRRGHTTVQNGQAHFVAFELLAKKESEATDFGRTTKKERSKDLPK